MILTGANRNDVTQLLPLLHAIPTIRGKRGRPRQRPDAVLADSGYDHDKYRRLVRALQIRPLIARCGTPHGSGLGRQRWVVERAFALLHAFRRLRIRWEARADIHEAFLKLACALICRRRLKLILLGALKRLLPAQAARGDYRRWRPPTPNCPTAT